MPPPTVIVVGGGPAGLMAAGILAAAGARTTLLDAMPSVGRKFLLAGKGGLNLTHSESLPGFVSRYGAASEKVGAWLQRFGPQQLRDFAATLGIDTFVGSSGRVFPSDMKAGPMMRRWVSRLREAGVVFQMRHRFLGWNADGSLRVATPDGEIRMSADLLILALGGGSWAKLGSDGAWTEALVARGVAVAPLHPANCGFECDWSAPFRERFEGAPLKAIAARVPDARPWQRGECVITRDGIEGSLVYGLSAPLRDAIQQHGHARLELDLLPDRSQDAISEALSQPRGSRSRSEHWRRRLGLSGVKAGLLHEILPRESWDDSTMLARTLKALPLRLTATRPIDEAISSAGGISFDAVDERLMLRAAPGSFVAGEMLDWEAPTGGYLLTASIASGVIAAEGALAWWKERHDAL
ncbi:MAG: TIGR03862 family flavoprotein [Lysobacteraceae bacterium]